MPKRNILWVLAIVAASAVTIWVMRDKRSPVRTGNSPQVHRMVKALDQIKRTYHKPIEEDKLLRGAIRGMIRQLDEYSSYIPPEKIARFHRRMDGQAEGLGMRVVRERGSILVSQVAYDSPAQRGGIRPGDRILAIDSEILLDMDIEDIRRKFDLEAGSSVELMIESPEKPQPSVLTASHYPVESVTGYRRRATGQWIWMLDDEHSIGYLRIREFVNDTPEALQKSIRAMGNIRNLVLDLRDNPGGKGDVAIRVADLFLRKGAIAHMVGRSGRSIRHEAHARGALPKIKLAVLINGKTASGAELVAGALRDNHRGVLVGTRTRGKGCVQSMIDLGEDLGLVNVTTSQFFPPDKREITRHSDSESWGIQPHRQVDISADDLAKLRRLRARLSMPPKSPTATAPHTTPSDTQPIDADIILRDDRQLKIAMEILADKKTYESILAKTPATSTSPTKSPDKDNDD